MPSIKSIFAAASLTSLASAETIRITATSDNKFDPDSLTAKGGDVLEFHFEPKNHSVVAGDYRYPCSPLELGTGFYSGYISTDDGKADQVFRVTLNDTEPLVFYSSQGDECSNGMVGIVNQNDERNLTDYRDRASSLSRAVAPGREPYGGEVVDGDEANDRDKNGKDGNDNQGTSGTVRAPILRLLGAVAVVFVMA